MGGNKFLQNLSPENQVSPEWGQSGFYRSWTHSGDNESAIVSAQDPQLN